MLAIHDFDQDNGLGGPEHMRARHRPWRERVVQLAKSRVNREFEFYHEFRAEDYVAPPHQSRAHDAMLGRRASLVSSGHLHGETSLVDVNYGQTLMPQVH